MKDIFLRNLDYITVEQNIPFSVSFFKQMNFLSSAYI